MYEKYLKRILDIFFSLSILIFFSWLMVLISLGYLVTREWPVFFSQERTGKHGRVFLIHKFRTFKVSDEPLEKRRFGWGNFLRSTSLDELPQLWNVLVGEMSVVGPRPLPVDYFRLLSQEQRLRYAVRPGITGWAQINGRTSIPWQEKFKLDLFYTRNISLWLDLKIIFRTILLFFSFRGNVTLDKKPFTGNG